MSDGSPATDEGAAGIACVLGLGGVLAVFGVTLGRTVAVGLDGVLAVTRAIMAVVGPGVATVVGLGVVSVAATLALKVALEVGAAVSGTSGAKRERATEPFWAAFKETLGVASASE